MQSFDTIDHRRLLELLRRGVNDGGRVRLIGQWLNAGVLEGETLTHTTWKVSSFAGRQSLCLSGVG